MGKESQGKELFNKAEVIELTTADGKRGSGCPGHVIVLTLNFSNDHLIQTMQHKIP